MRVRTRGSLAAGVGLLAPALAGACAANPGALPCRGPADCAPGDLCVEGLCVAAAGVDGGPGGDGGADAGGDPCAACAADEVCAYGECMRAAPCASHDDCDGDRYCDPIGQCIPYGFGTPPVRQSDTECTREIPPGAFQPTVQCEFTAAPAGDPFPGHLHVLSTPMVVDLKMPAGPDEPLRPSIVAVFDDGGDGSSELPTGVIRILDGETCAQEWELGSLALTSHSSPPAVGDITGDGRADIVAFKAGGGLVAFTYDEPTSAWRVLWRSTAADGVTAYNPTGGGWAGPSIYDLDGDGAPEILRGALVFDAAGRLLDDSIGAQHYSSGVFPVIADVDGDGRAEWVGGAGIYEWAAGGAGWVLEGYSPAVSEAGHVAIADFGAYPGSVGWSGDTPEVVVISAGSARVQTLDGALVFGPHAIPGGGAGGPPTIADFDGDGHLELATAGAERYVVFDLETGGVLWERASQDASSNRTGSSVFDFEGDGRAEAVYGDECFLRVYDGATGDVLFSQYRSSCTWYENPIIADVDGDFNAEIVIGNNRNCGGGAGVSCRNLGPRDTDPIFPGLRCDADGDCVSGRCVEGLCRCTSDAECCSGPGCDLAGFVCATPLAGTVGEGDVCRAAHPTGSVGIRVYQDRDDRWVRSRAIWNQHAYHVTNVRDDGTIPALGEVEPNWRTPGLNDFRKNTQGSAVPDAAPDLTVRGRAQCDGGEVRFEAQACNRGTEPVAPGVVVTFSPAAGGAAHCSAVTRTVLDPGSCEPVECSAAAPAVLGDVAATIDEGGAVGECHEENNRAPIDTEGCDSIG